MTKFKHKESRAHQLYARIPFGYIVFAVLMAFALTASLGARAGEPVDAYDMIWDSEILASFESAHADYEQHLEMLTWQIEHDSELYPFTIEMLLDAHREMVQYWTITETVNELAKDPSFMCDEAPTEAPVDIKSLTKYHWA